MEHAARAGITEAEYWDSSPRYVMARIRGQREADQFRYEAGWEQARLVAWAIRVQHDKRLRKPQDFIKFPWETNAKARQIDEAQRAAMMAQLDAAAADFFAS